MASPGLERLQPALGPELEERVGLEPGLLGLPVLLRADRRLHAVERQRDQVVVGLVVGLLPLVRHEGGELVLDPVAERLDVLGRAHAVGLLRRVADDRAELVEPGLDGLRLRAVALGELVLEVGERGGGAGAEGDGLLDLEVERDLGPAHAAVVLDGHEREELQELLRAPRGLLGGQRRGGEPLEPSATAWRAARNRAASPVRAARARRGLARGLVGGSLYINFDQSEDKTLSFQVDYVRRFLLRREVTFELDDDQKPVPLVIGKGPRDYLKTTLEYDFSKFAGFTLSYEYGRLPPNYQLVDHKYSLGLVYNSNRLQVSLGGVD